MAAGYGLVEWDLISGSARDFPSLHSVQTGSEVHPVSYKMGTGDSFPGGKAAGG
jgi:hypothetical protein